jgi:hypothetical protein
MFGKVIKYIKRFFSRKSEARHYFEYMQASGDFVIRGLEKWQITYATDQDEYLPLVGLQSHYGDGEVLSRWPLTESQRRAIADGADIYLSLLTFHGPVQPVKMGIGINPDADYFRNSFGYIDDQKEGLKAS